jgi:hypothetical protein
LGSASDSLAGDRALAITNFQAIDYSMRKASPIVKTSLSAYLQGVLRGFGEGGRNGRASRSRSPESKQLIRIDVDGDGDIFGERQFVECLADEPAQAHDGFAAHQNVEAELAL